MTDIKQLYLGFEGRIGRKTFWLGVSGMVFAAFALFFIVTPLLGGSAFTMATMMNEASLEPDALAELVMDLHRKSGWAKLVIFAILFVPLSALFIKRRHDRGATGKEFWALAVLAVVMYLLQATGIGYSAVDVGDLIMPVPDMLTTIVSLGVAVLVLYLLVVAGILKGNEGENAYGPDPLKDMI